MPKSFWLFLLTILAFVFGCGSDNAGTEIASVSIVSLDIKDGVLPIVRNEETPVGVVAKDASGATVKPDMDSIVWEAADPAICRIEKFGDIAAVIGLKDWFDTVPPDDPTAQGYEPETEITVRLNGKSDKVRVQVVIDCTGTWRTMLDGGERMDLTLTQEGRKIINPLSPVAGELKDNLFSFEYDIYSLTGQFVSRTEVQGTYSTTDGKSGVWAAKKIN